jgi:RND superfamily putative drug exporter
VASLARICVRGRWWIILGWVAAVLVLVVGSSRTGDDYRESYLFEGTESRDAAGLIAHRFPDTPGDRAQLVVRDRVPVDGWRYQLELLPLLNAVKASPHVAAIEHPWEDRTGSRFSPDRDTAIIDIVFSVEAADLPPAEVEDLVALTEQWSTVWRQVELGGATIDAALQPGPGDNERYGLLIALLILLVVFGSVVAAGLPIVVAVAGVGGALGAVGLVSHLMPVSTFAPQLATLVGLGAGIDYALFVLTRYRSALEHGEDVESAVTIAVSTAGRAVLFAGVTVAVALLGLLVLDVEFVTGLAVGAAVGVACTMLAAVTLLPAVLAVVGRGVERLRIGRTGGRGTHWRRWAGNIQRRPVMWSVIGLAVLATLSAPAFVMRLGTVDAGVNPDSSTTRRAYDIVSEEFGPGANGPLYVVTDLLPDGTVDDVSSLVEALRADDGVAAVEEAQFDRAGVTALVTVVPATAPDSAETTELVHRLRDEVLAPHADDTGTRSVLGGVTAAFVDQSDLLGGRLPALVAVVLLASFLLLTVVFRGVLVAVKAAVLNLLSVTAAYGIIVAVFQWGWGIQLVGLDRPGPIIAFAPVFMFAILFGLSMDYEVFLLSRVREEYERHGDNSRAVTEGLASTGRVITAAAAVMVAVFGSFVLGDDPVMKLFGVGLAAAILVDATIVRTILVPATMELLGDLNWWLPAALRRRLPQQVVPAQVSDTEPKPGTTVDDPYLVALATGHSTLLDHATITTAHIGGPDWPAEVGGRPMSLPGLFQAIAFVEDDNAAVLRVARDTSDPTLYPVVDLAVLFSERHRDLAIDRVDELILLGTPPPDPDGVRTDPATQSLAGRARRTEHLWRVAETFLETDRIEIVSATAIRWWLRRSSSQWRELGRRGLLHAEPGVIPNGIHRLYHLIAETEHAGAVALYRFAELDDAQLARLADRRRSLAKLFRDRLSELDDRAPLPPLGEWTEAVPAPVVVGDDMNDELADHPLDAALLDWYRREVAEVMAETRARGIPVDDSPIDPARLPTD